MVHVLAVIELAPGRRDDFLAELRRVVPLVRQEAGCLEYGPAADATTGIANQHRLGDDVVVIVEKWESLAALEAHLDAPHMHEYRPKVRDMIVSARLHVLQPV